MATVTTSGIWTSVSTQLAQMNGLNTNHLSWGVPYVWRNMNPGKRQSSYQFEGVSGVPVLLDGAEFKLGTFTHHNFNLNPPPIVFSTNLQVTMRFDGGALAREFNFTFQHEETVNSPGPVPDEVLLPSLQSKETVTIDGVEYAVHITGFRQDGQVVGKFISQEDRSNSADIVAKLVAVAKPEPKVSVCETPDPVEGQTVTTTQVLLPEAKPPPEERCRVKQVVDVSAVFTAVLTRLNSRSVAHVLEQVIAEVNAHCEQQKGGGGVDITVVQQHIEALTLKLQLLQKSAQELDAGELAQVEELLKLLLTKIDLRPILQNIHIDIDGRSFDLRRVIEVTTTLDQVVNIQLLYSDTSAGDIIGVLFVLTDRTQVRFTVRTIEQPSGLRVVYVFETRDWKGLPAQFSLTFARRSRTHKLCDREVVFDLFDGVEQSNIVFDLCPRIAGPVKVN